MADRIRVSDLDFVYISYAEPNKEQNWADLKNKVPWAKRVDGVKGFDSAHKAAAETAETDFFISVDGDNIIDETGQKQIRKLYTDGGQRTTSMGWFTAMVVWLDGTSKLASTCGHTRTLTLTKIKWTSVGEYHTRTYITAILPQS